MIQVTIVKNPFEPAQKTVKQLEYCPIRTVKGYCPDGEVYIINGRRVEHPELAVPHDGDLITVTAEIQGGGFGKIFGFVAIIALMAYAGAVAGGLWASAAGSAFAHGAVGAVLAAGAIMVVGGKIISSIFPQSINDELSYNSDSKTSQSYGWNVPVPTSAEGNVMGITYGDCIPQPQVLTQHVETIDGQQYLNLLLCGGQGPVDDISEIRIGDNDIGNYTAVEVEKRYGTNDQAPINFFNNNPIDQYVEVELSNVAVIQTTKSASATAIEVTVSFPGGLFRINDDGNNEETHVTIQLLYRTVGATGWTSWQDWTITANQNSELNKSLRLTGLTPAQYEVSACITYRDKSTRASSITKWLLLTTYDQGYYSRPGKVLVGLRILATNQLSGGVPSVNWRQRRSTVLVYDPDAGAYVDKPADNPIWAAYDILHQCYRLHNINTGLDEYVVEGVPKERLTKYYSEWVAAAAYSDELILNEQGVKEKRFMFDAFFDTKQKRITAAQRAAAVGHAVILRHGNSLGIVVDKPGSISQVFGEGRTLVSSVNGYFTSLDERAREIEITYNDRNNRFKNSKFLTRISGWHYDDAESDTAELTLFGVSRRSQAWREGIKALAVNQRQLQFLEFEADVDAMRCEYGDIIGWNHKVNQIGIASGRIIAATSTTVRLDKTVTMAVDKLYQIYLMLSDDTLVTRSVKPVEGTTNLLTLESALSSSEVPAKYDNYCFGESGKAVKPFKIVSVGMSPDQQFSIKCAEYDEACYADSALDYSKYPVKDYTAGSALQAPTALHLTEINYLRQDKSLVSMVRAKWSLPRGAAADTFEVSYSTDNSNWKIWEQTANMSSDITDVNPPGTCYIRIIAILGGVFSAPIVSSIIMTGYDELPPDVVNFHHELLANNRRRFWWDYTYPSPNDVAGFRLKYMPGVATNWDDAVALHDGVITAQPFETDVLRQGICCVMVKAVDNRGQESKNAATLMINLGDVLEENVLYKQDLSANDWSIVTHDGFVENGVLHGKEISTMWTSRTDAMWQSPSYPMWSGTWMAFNASFQFTVPASGQFWMNLSTTGSIAVTYSIGTSDLYWYPYTQKVKVKVGDIINVKLSGRAGSKNSVKRAVIYIDVPDQVQHFENLEVPTTGLTLPITIPSYYTVGVRIDAVSDSSILYVDYITKNPCVIRLRNASGDFVAKTVDLTWQGFIKEVS